MERNELSSISWNRVFELIGEPNQSKCWRFYRENHEAIDKARGSKTKHQAWEGGLIDHICECVGVAIELHSTLNRLRPLEFTLSDVALVLFWHDMEKPWKHQIGEKIGGERINNKIVDSSNFAYGATTSNALNPKFLFVLNKVKEYGIELSDSQLNALTYVEGEKTDYSPYERVQNPLAAFCSCCDLISARIWFNYPKG